MSPKKKQFLFIVTVCITSTIVLLFLGYNLLSNNLLNNNSRENEIFIDKEDHSGADPEKGEELAKLESKTPYTGEYFSIILNDELGKYEVYINPSNTSAGTQEFYKFLSENNLTINDFRPYYVSSSTPF